MPRTLALILLTVTLTTPLDAQSSAPPAPAPTDNPAALGDFPVVEFRRYRIKPGEQEHFARYFESYFPPAFEQLGAVAAGSFFVRGTPDRFTWIRGYHVIEQRAVINAAFYYGPVWREHRVTLNNLIEDSDDVLLLGAVAGHPLPILPAVDPVREPAGAGGVVVSIVCQLTPGATGSLLERSAAALARLKTADLIDAGLLTTLDVPNNFPQLPVRTDGPYVVWLGVLPDNSALARFRPVAEQVLQALTGTGLLRSAPELVILDPTPRSRLRWLSAPTATH